MDTDKYIGKMVRVFETGTRYYDGVIHDVKNEDRNIVFIVADNEYGLLSRVKKEQLKEIVITMVLKDLE
jgi:RNase P/RNase MRP subunit p29